MKKLILGIAMIAAVVSCKQKSKNQTPVLTKQTEDSLLQLAQNTFKKLPVTADINSNPLTPQKVKLGKILFFDSRLSMTGKNSCNSCHNLSTYGVDNLPTSIGDAGKNGNRNSPTVFNAALQNMQFWDGRAADVEEQAGMPILNSVEMAIPHKGFLINRLSSIKLYQDLFKAAFPNDKKPITYNNLQKAIGAFERTLITPSRFDRYMAGYPDALTIEEKLGLKVFSESGCTSCHNGVNIGGGSMQKFGLVTDYRSLIISGVDDEGKKQVSQKPQDKDIFKVPGLRNIAGTYPYFHNGSVTSLDTAVKIMATAQVNRKLTDVQVKQIVAFLNALSGRISPEAKIFPQELANK